MTEAAATEKAKLDAEKDAAFAKAALDADMRQGEGCGVQGGAGHGEGGRTGRGHEGRAGRVPGGVRPEVEPDGDGAECGGTGGTARAGNIGHWDLATPVDCEPDSFAKVYLSAQLEEVHKTLVQKKRSIQINVRLVRQEDGPRQHAVHQAPVHPLVRGARALTAGRPTAWRTTTATTLGTRPPLSGCEQRPASYRPPKSGLRFEFSYMLSRTSQPRTSTCFLAGITCGQYSIRTERRGPSRFR